MHENMTRQPSYPGEILQGLYMEPLGLSVKKLSDILGVSRSTLSAIINGKSSMTVDMSMRLAQAFGTTPELWLNLQRNLDIWKLRQKGGKWQEVKKIHTSEEAIA